MFSKFNEEVRKVLIMSKMEMKKLKHPYIGTEHFVLSILKKENIISNMLLKYDVTYDKFKSEIINSIGEGAVDNSLFIYTPLMKKIIENSIMICKEKNLQEVNLECMFLSFLEEGEGIAMRILLGFGVDVDFLYDNISFSKCKKKVRKELIIDGMGVDLNKKVIENAIDPVIGRDEEIARIIEILCRRTKNNPLLIGAAGVGKTAIVEELSRRIVNGDVPLKLLNKKIFSISMASLVSGTKYRGEFEERVTKMLNELEDSGDIILFIDEIHTLVGAGGAEGAIDASNILKPSLSRGKVNIIGATTDFEYKKYIEIDKALCRRFQNVIIEEPDSDKVFEILLKLKPFYEKFHNVLIKDSSLRQIVKLSDKYLYNRKQPDKAIDILDEVCSKTSILENDLIKRSVYYKKILTKIRDLKNNAILSNNFDEAISLKEEEFKLESCINKLDIKLIKSNKKNEVDDILIAEVIRSKSNIPVYELIGEKNILSELKEYLYKNVLGQDEAIDEMCKYTERLVNGFKLNKKPMSFLFVGPTGVGKTFLAKEYNKIMFGEKNLIRIDMSEYKEEHSISKILGSPPGYVGFNNKQTFLEEVKEKPHSVILLDEIDKAHPSVLNLFLQILDDGKIKDSAGNVYRFDNNIIIMTSNCGSKLNKVGFFSDIKDNIIDEVKKHFSIEFVNRIDKVIVFNKLSQESIIHIINKTIDKICNIQNIKFNVTNDIINKIIKESDYEIFGARKLNRIIFSIIEDYLLETVDSKI